MKCKTGFEEKNGKCIKKEIIKTYCDTNIVTASINKKRLGVALGHHGYLKHRNSIRSNSSDGEEQLRNIKKCVISRNPLISDIGKYKPSLGAVLSLSSIEKIKVEDVNGLKEGRVAYNKACEDVKKDSNFYKKFCEKRKLKQNKNLAYNDLNDVMHIGSAIKLGAEEFVTLNRDDFEPLKKHIGVKLRW